MVFEPRHQELRLGSTVLAEAYWIVARENARLMASLMEPVLCNTFTNLSPAANPNDYYDLLLNKNSTVEVRTIKDGTLFSFEASANVGGNRDGKSPQVTQAKLELCDYWVFCNISNFPVVKIYVFSKAQVTNLCAKYKKPRQQFTVNQVKGLL